MPKYNARHRSNQDVNRCDKNSNDSNVSVQKAKHLSETTKQIQRMTPKNPADDYPEARSINRHFIIHVGGTNTGKTHDAIEALLKNESGIYLGPLRLLALEIQERLNDTALSPVCSLTTGEEEDIVPGAAYLSATVEKLNTKIYYATAIIDECQMISDESRGGAWTRAILGAYAAEVHLCVAPEGLEICKKLITMCGGDTFQVQNHTRLTGLQLCPPLQSLNELQPGDALITFTRKGVLALAAELEKKNIKASVIYGSLPYQARKEQIQKFLHGETQVVIATDAIGMGMNLPIRRVVFTCMEKFDGINVRKLKISEIKQIAGRAGRYKMYDVGYVTTLYNKSDYEYIASNLDATVPPIIVARVPFPEYTTSINQKLSIIMKQWGTTRYMQGFIAENVDERVSLIQYMEKYYSQFSKDTVLRLSKIPFDIKNEDLLHQWQQYVDDYARHENTMSKPYSQPDDILDKCETFYRQLDLYYSFAKASSMCYDMQWQKETKDITIANINKLLQENMKAQAKKCKVCGCKLPWNYPYTMCEDCFFHSLT
jgi:hypothetical protein